MFCFFHFMFYELTLPGIIQSSVPRSGWDCKYQSTIAYANKNPHGNVFFRNFILNLIFFFFTNIVQYCGLFHNMFNLSACLSMYTVYILFMFMLNTKPKETQLVSIDQEKPPDNKKTETSTFSFASQQPGFSKCFRSVRLGSYRNSNFQIYLGLLKK